MRLVGVALVRVLRRREQLAPRGDPEARDRLRAGGVLEPRVERDRIDAVQVDRPRVDLDLAAAGDQLARMELEVEHAAGKRVRGPAVLGGVADVLERRRDIRDLGVRAGGRERQRGRERGRDAGAGKRRAWCHGIACVNRVIEPGEKRAPARGGGRPTTRILP